MTVTEYINENLPKTVKYNPQDDGTLIGLPFRYTVPCPDEMFLEMYYWDTYFTNTGLIATGNLRLAKSNVDNMLYLVNKYGFMPNGNRTYYLTRSQPPFLFMAVSDIFEETGDKEWLSSAYDTLSKEYDYWQSEHMTPDGLNFYGNREINDQSRIDALCKYYSSRVKCNTEGISPDLKLRYAHCMMAFAESGWDCTSRFGDNARYYEPVCLNSLLWGLENKMAAFSRILGRGDEEKWSALADSRKQKMERLMYDKGRGIMLDRSFSDGHLSPVFSVASFYPLFVGMKERPDGEINALKELMLPYGVAATNNSDAVHGYQWDYPHVWAPLQYVAYKSFKNCGCDDIANEIKDKYIALIETNFEKTGRLWEKYNGSTGEVANEDYNAPAMLGWTAGVYMYFKTR